MSLSDSQLREIVGLVCRLASEARDGREYESLTLAAHLFALCSFLRKESRSGNLEVAELADFASDTAAIEALVSLGVASASTLYAQLLGALQAFDSTFNADRDGLAMPASTKLTVISSCPGFFGEVWHWARERASWKQLRFRRAHSVPGLNSYPRWPEDYLENIGMMWERYDAPKIEPVAGASASALAAGSGFRLQEGRLRIALCPLAADCGPHFRINEAGNQFVIDNARQVDDDAKLRQHLATLIQDAKNEELHLLVLPELSVPGDMREMLIGALRSNAAPSLLGIIAGSFHVWRQEGGHPHNEAAVLSGRGVLWCHDKRGYFRVTKGQVEGLMRHRFAEPLPPLRDVIVEGIEQGDVLRVLDTTLGRLAIIVCADVLDESGGYLPALRRARPDFVFFVSMSGKCGPFLVVAEQLAQLQVSSLYVNAASVCPSGEDLAFACLALAEPAGAPATRVRWRAGRRGLLRGNPRTSPVTWKMARGVIKGVSLLPTGRGLVVDLGEHWGFGLPVGGQAST